MNIEFTIKVYASLWYWKHESKLQHDPIFCFKKSKTTLKMCYIKIEYVVF